MRCGLFGKLSAKRDFIAVATPRNFLEVWESWVQSSISASRHQLGQRWQQAFLTAPLWRFWLGSGVCGAPVLGAMMSSVDALGRHYPLTLHVVSDAQALIPPPEIDAQDEWFAAVEQFLLSTLADGASFDVITTALGGLEVPRMRSRPQESGSIVSVGPGMAGMPVTESDFASSLAALRLNGPDIDTGMSYWWTAGGDEFPAFALCCRGLPDPYHFSALLTGDMVAGSAPER